MLILILGVVGLFVFRGILAIADVFQCQNVAILAFGVHAELLEYVAIVDVFVFTEFVFSAIFVFVVIVDSS